MDAKLNNDLLKASSDDEKKGDRPKKRNSKEELIDKIMQVAEHNTIPIPHSDTRLKRMTKQQLNELLAEVIEKAMRNEMARQVGAKPGAADSVIALGALRMVHDICAKGTEQCFNIFLPQYGYGRWVLRLAQRTECSGGYRRLLGRDRARYRCAAVRAIPVGEAGNRVGRRISHVRSEKENSL